MKKRGNSKVFLMLVMLPVIMVITRSCEMPASGFEDVEPGVYLEKANKSLAPLPDSAVVIMTWNIRYGFARGPWFGDACGYKVIYSEKEIIENMKAVAERIREVNPDILLLQEADINSSRSAYVDQVKFILNNTDLNYAAYGLQWKAQFVPSDGLGRVEEANVIMSRWKLKDAKRFQLERRSDQMAIERYFYERYCMVEAITEIPGFKDLSVLNIHASAFSTDDTKKLNLASFKKEVDALNSQGRLFVAGGDLNSLPPGSVKTDYCIEDMCENESYHRQGDDPMHKIGSDYTKEDPWMEPLFNSYKSAITLNELLAEPERYFSHTTRPGFFWDRTLDYLFTNVRWRSGNSLVRQDFLTDSDHAPVVGELILVKN